MPRRYTRRSNRSNRPFKTVKYSSETSAVSNLLTLAASSEASIPIALISAANIQGTRKVKNFTLRFAYAPPPMPLAFVVAYIPEGQAPQSLNFGDASTVTSLYEPNQNVIMQGILPQNPDSALSFRTRLARNLNSGDAIALIIRPLVPATTATNISFGITFNYAITF